MRRECTLGLARLLISWMVWSFAILLLTPQVASALQISVEYLDSSGSPVEEIFACTESYTLQVTASDYGDCPSLSLDPVYPDMLESTDPLSLETGSTTFLLPLQNLCALSDNTDLQISYEACGENSTASQILPGFFAPQILFDAPSYFELDGSPAGNADNAACPGLYRKSDSHTFVREWVLDISSGSTDGFQLSYDAAGLYEITSVECATSGTSVSANVADQEFQITGTNLQGELLIREHFVLLSCEIENFETNISLICLGEDSAACNDYMHSTCLNVSPSPNGIIRDFFIRDAAGDELTLDVCGEDYFEVHYQFQNSAAPQDLSANTNIKRLKEFHLPIDLGVLTEYEAGAPTEDALIFLQENVFIEWDNGSQSIPLGNFAGLDLQYIDDGAAYDGFHRFVLLDFSMATEQNSPLISWFDPNFRNCLAEDSRFSVVFKNLSYEAQELRFYTENSYEGHIASEVTSTGVYTLFGNKHQSTALYYDNMCGAGQRLSDRQNFGSIGGNGSAAITMTNPDISCGHGATPISATITVPTENRVWSFAAPDQDPLFFNECDDSYKINIEVGHFVMLHETSQITISGQGNSISYDIGDFELSTEAFNYGPNIGPCTNTMPDCLPSELDIYGITETYSIDLDPSIPGAGNQIEIELNVDITVDECFPWEPGMDYPRFAISLSSECDESCPESEMMVCRDEISIFYHCCGPCVPITCESESTIGPFDYAGYPQSTFDFNFNRITPGWTDESMTTLVDLEDPNTTYYRERAYEFDAIEVTSSGYLNPSSKGVEQLSYHIRYENPEESVENPMQYFQLLEGSFSLTFQDIGAIGFEVCNGLDVEQSDCIIPEPPLLADEFGEPLVMQIPVEFSEGDEDCGECSLLFDIPIDLALPQEVQVQTGLQNLRQLFDQDQHTCTLFTANIDFEATFMVREIPAEYDRLLDFDGIIRGQFISNPTIDDDEEWVYSCDDWGSLFNILNTQVVVEHSLHQPNYLNECLGITEEASSCESIYHCQVFLDQAIPDQDEFPNEFRPIYRFLAYQQMSNSSPWLVHDMNVNSSQQDCEALAPTELSAQVHDQSSAFVNWQTLALFADADGSNEVTNFFGDLQLYCPEDVNKDLLTTARYYYLDNFYSQTNVNSVCLELDDCSVIPQPSLAWSIEQLELDKDGDIVLLPSQSLDITQQNGLLALDIEFDHDSRTFIENFWFDFATSSIEINNIILNSVDADLPDIFFEQIDGLFSPVDGSLWQEGQEYTLEIYYDIADVPCDELLIGLAFGYQCFGEDVCQEDSREYQLEVPTSGLDVQVELQYESADACGDSFLEVTYTNTGGSDIQEIQMLSDFPDGVTITAFHVESENINTGATGISIPADFDITPMLGLPLAPGATLIYTFDLLGTCDLYDVESIVQFNSIASDICGLPIDQTNGLFQFSENMSFDVFDPCLNTCIECVETCCDAQILTTLPVEQGMEVCQGEDRFLLWSEPFYNEIDGVFSGEGITVEFFGQLALYYFDPSSLAAGSHTVTLTYTHEDGSICEVTEEILIHPAIISNGFVSSNDCSGEGGQIMLTAATSTGNEALEFEWSEGLVPVVETWNSSTVSGLSAGSYTVTVTSINGCTSEETFEIDPPNLAIYIDGLFSYSGCETSEPVYVWTDPLPWEVDVELTGPGISPADFFGFDIFEFDPSEAGPGNHVINASYVSEDGTVCNSSAIVTVISSISLGMEIPHHICTNEDPIPLVGFVGNYEGPVYPDEVSSNPPGIIEYDEQEGIFYINPALAETAQAYHIEYGYTDENGCPFVDVASVAFIDCWECENNPFLAYEYNLNGSELCINPISLGQVEGVTSDVVEVLIDEEWVIMEDGDLHCLCVDQLDLNYFRCNFSDELNEITSTCFGAWGTCDTNVAYQSGITTLYVETGSSSFTNVNTNCTDISDTAPQFVNSIRTFDTELCGQVVSNDISVTVDPDGTGCDRFIVELLTNNNASCPTEPISFRRTVSYEGCETDVFQESIIFSNCIDGSCDVEIIVGKEGPGRSISDGATNSEPEWTVYPNPASDLVSIDFKVIGDASGNLSLYDISGRLVYQEALILDENSGREHQISVADFARGVYLLNFESASMSLRSKLVIE